MTMSGVVDETARQALSSSRKETHQTVLAVPPKEPLHLCVLAGCRKDTGKTGALEIRGGDIGCRDELSLQLSHSPCSPLRFPSLI